MSLDSFLARLRINRSDSARGRAARRKARQRALFLESLEPRQLLTYAGAVLADNPTGFWQMDETGGTTLVDSAPGGGVQNGTYAGSPVFSQPAAVAGPGTSVRFDPANSAYATVPNVPMTASFTVEMWVKSATATWNDFGWWGAERAANGFIMHAESGRHELDRLRRGR